MPGDELFAAQGDTDAATKTTETTETKESAQETTETKESAKEEDPGKKETAEAKKADEPAKTDPEIDPAKFTVPEGFDGLDQAVMQEFLPFAKELKLTQDQAQQVINMHAKALQGTVQKMTAQQAAATEAGAAEVKAMFGANYEQNMGKIQHLLQEYGGEDAVKQPIYGNKVVMDTLLKIAEAAGPGRFVAGRQTGTVRDADLLFDAKGD